MAAGLHAGRVRAGAVWRRVEDVGQCNNHHRHKCQRNACTQAHRIDCDILRKFCLTAPNGPSYFLVLNPCCAGVPGACCETLACILVRGARCRSVAARAAPVRCSQFRRRFKMMTERTAVKMMHEPANQQKSELNFAKGVLRQSDEGQHETG